MPKIKESKDEGKREDVCPNCGDTGHFDDDGVEINCPCKALKD